MSSHVTLYLNSCTISITTISPAQINSRTNSSLLVPATSSSSLHDSSDWGLPKGENIIPLVCSSMGTGVFVCSLMWPKCMTCCAVAQWCPTLCNPMDCRTPGFAVLRHLQEIAQTNVHQVSDTIQLPHPLSSPSPDFSLSQHQGKDWLF